MNQNNPHVLRCPDCGHNETVDDSSLSEDGHHTVRSLAVKLQKTNTCPKCNRSLGLSEA